MDFGNNITIRRLFEDERPATLDLAWRVFSEYESPDYSSEGTEEFQKCLHDEEYLHGLQYYGAYGRTENISAFSLWTVDIIGAESARECFSVCLKTTRMRQSPSIPHRMAVPSIRRLVLC